MKYQPKKKERTVAYPHRIFNKTSIYLLDKEHIENSDFIGYQGVSANGDTTITVQSKELITPKDGRVFDYVLSRIQALGKDNLKVTIDTVEILDELGLSNRTENRQKVIDSLIRMVDVSIVLAWDGGEVSLTMFESVKAIDGTNTVDISLHQSFVDAMDITKTRFISIQRTMKAKSIYTIELAKVLMMNGRSVVKSTGAPDPVKEMDHKLLCQYLHFEDIEMKATMTQLRKAFTELEELGYPKYSYITGRKLWKRIDK